MAGKDFVQRARDIALQSIGEQEKTEPPITDKDPAAVALGSKGGKARAAKLTAKQRSDIGKKAAEKRWPKS